MEAYQQIPVNEKCAEILTINTQKGLYTGWNDKIVVQKKTILQLYFKTFIEKINSGNLIM